DNHCKKVSSAACATSSSRVLVQPRREGALLDPALSQRQHLRHDRFIRCGDFPTLFEQKQRRSEKCYSLVAVDKRVIANNAERVGGGDVESGRRRVCSAIYRSR